jgi:hypothetical protein
MSSRQTRKLKDRKSPSTSATLYPEGTIEFGKDKNRWVVKQTETGVKRWVPVHSTSLFGYTALTAKILEKNINKPVVVYERQSTFAPWPRAKSDFDVKYTFTASGDAELISNQGKNVKVFPNWLKTRTPKVKSRDLFIIKGTMKSKDIESSIQVAPHDSGELVSSNLMNTEAFVKVA